MELLIRIFVTTPSLMFVAPLVLLGTTISGLWNLHDIIRSDGWRGLVRHPSQAAKSVFVPILCGVAILAVIALLSFISSLFPDECYRNYTC